MLIQYRKDNDKATGIRFTDDFDPTKDKLKVLINLGKSNAKLEELEKELAIEKERNDKLISIRHQIYKNEKLNELKIESNDQLLNKKDLIELFYSQGKQNDEIALLTGSKADYIYKVICNYRKRNGLRVERPTQSETEEIILMCSRANQSIEEIAVNAKVSRQYVYRVLKKYNIAYPTRKKSKGKMRLQK